MVRQLNGSGRGATRRAQALASAAGRAGFTLLESMMALVIIGVGILAYVDAQSAFTQTNTWSTHAGTGMLLANEIREMVRRLPRHDPVTGLYLEGSGAGAALRGWGLENGEIVASDIDDIDDLDGCIFGLAGTFPGPIDAFGNMIPAVDDQGNIINDNGEVRSLEGWTQRVTVAKVDPYNFNTLRADNYEQVASSQLPAIPVSGFPLKVTVLVQYQSLTDVSPQDVTQVTWVVPAQ
jgi:prepilin-type N-terminal cleavage/methylation domain-containing protein